MTDQLSSVPDQDIDPTETLDDSIQRDLEALRMSDYAARRPDLFQKLSHIAGVPTIPFDLREVSAKSVKVEDSGEYQLTPSD